MHEAVSDFIKALRETASLCPHPEDQVRLCRGVDADDVQRYMLKNEGEFEIKFMHKPAQANRTHIFVLYKENCLCDGGFYVMSMDTPVRQGPYMDAIERLVSVIIPLAFQGRYQPELVKLSRSYNGSIHGPEGTLVEIKLSEIDDPSVVITLARFLIA